MVEEMSSESGTSECGSREPILSATSSVDSGVCLDRDKSPSEEASCSSSSSTSKGTEEEEFVKRCYWDWPLNGDGVAMAEERRDSFQVCLDFGRSNRSLSVRRFENFGAASASWIVGLSPVQANLTSAKRPSQNHWRLEIEILRSLHMILINVTREVFRNDKGRTMKRIRKMYRIPSHFDMETLHSEMTESGQMLFQVQRQRQPPLHRRRRPTRLNRSNTIA